jgi:coproporphyrinogen III oxidase
MAHRKTCLAKIDENGLYGIVYDELGEELLDYFEMEEGNKIGRYFFDYVRAKDHDVCYKVLRKNGNGSVRVKKIYSREMVKLLDEKYEKEVDLLE